MKVYALFTALALSLVLSTAPTEAQEAQLEIIAERPSQSNNTDPNIQQLRLLVTFETNVNDNQGDVYRYDFWDAITSVELEVYDPQNVMTSSVLYTAGASDNFNLIALSKPSDNQMQSLMVDLNNNLGNFSLMLSRIDALDPIIEAPTGFDNGHPKVKEVRNQSGSYELSVGSFPAQQNPLFAIDFDAHTVRYVVLDEDGDGVTDDIDQCPASVVTTTVMFGWLDSGVTNAVDANGCTISDRYMDCQEIVAAAATDIPSFQGPTYCEMQVTYSLYHDGLVDYSDVRQLRNSMITFYRSNPQFD